MASTYLSHHYHLVFGTKISPIKKNTTVRNRFAKN